MIRRSAIWPESPAERNRHRHDERLQRLHSHLCAKASEAYRVAMMPCCSTRLAKKLIETAERRCDRASTIRDLQRALWYAENSQSAVPEIEHLPTPSPAAPAADRLQTD